MHYNKPLYRIMGDCSLIVELGDKINPEINRSVSALTYTNTSNTPKPQSFSLITKVIEGIKAIRHSIKPVKRIANRMRARQYIRLSFSVMADGIILLRTNSRNRLK